MKRLVLALLTSLMATPFPALAEGRELGTLFFTPAERDMLDRARRGDPLAGASRRGEPVVNGFVKRSDGLATIWIDGREIDVKSKKVSGALQTGIVGNLNEAVDIHSVDERNKIPGPLSNRRPKNLPRSAGR
jgi:hypothetical protein